MVDSRAEALTKAGFRACRLIRKAHGLLHVWQLASRLYQRKVTNWLLVDIGVDQASPELIPHGRPLSYRNIAFGTLKTFCGIENPNDIETAFGSAQDLINLSLTWLKAQTSVAALFLGECSHQPIISGIWLMERGCQYANGGRRASERHFSVVSCESCWNPLSCLRIRSRGSAACKWIGNILSIAAGMAMSGLK